MILPVFVCVKTVISVFRCGLDFWLDRVIV